MRQAFSHARRVGELTWRDDRVANEFFLAEVFEIKDFMTVDPKTKWFQLELRNDHALSLLQAPDPEPRRTRFSLPHPCNVAHTIELYSVALPPTRRNNGPSNRNFSISTGCGKRWREIGR